MAIPFDQREGEIWLDGVFVPWADAKVHILTHALHYASSVFEGERAYGGEIFECEAHTDRLFASADALGFAIPYSKDTINEAKRATLARMGLTDAYLRPVAWRGSEMMGVSAQLNTIHVAIAAWAWPSYFDPALLEKGIRLDIASWQRPDPKTAPCHAKAAGLYMICTLSKHAAEAKGYTDALMMDYRGHVAEATGANVFFIKDGKIHTPVADCFLNGITRRTVMALAAKRGIEVIERTILPDELGTFSECFVTGTAAEVTPVGEIGPHHYTPGEMTRALMQDYADKVRPAGAAMRDVA
ncbi:branched-chain amino acid aminotransferase [Acuticoccus sp. MNP-M23]|uniref:branched-chain amino acid aminotransferase n=1 Tax=Acuticoccus sp. MNP-M23 TaxID=3072793 RepID=UPI0028158078|nr:branched-chain amino acid aminotransferase [Acuticoccus sp. MNP-M23]WMS43676.1 branched-chain amino acid aminotransferase [Acuticoccus sp. MNP-M23]